MAHSNFRSNNHQQNAFHEVELQSGVIVEKSHWIWSVLSFFLILGILFMVFFPRQTEQLFAFLSSFI